MILHLEKLFRRFGLDERGATAIEYALIAAVLALAITIPLLTVRDDLVALMQRLAAEFPT